MSILLIFHRSHHFPLFQPIRRREHKKYIYVNKKFVISRSSNKYLKNRVFTTNSDFHIPISFQPEAEFKEFEPPLKFKTRLKYGWFHLKSYSIFQDLSRRLIETSFFGDLRRGLSSLNSNTEPFLISN